MLITASGGLSFISPPACAGEMLHALATMALISQRRQAEVQAALHRAGLVLPEGEQEATLAHLCRRGLVEGVIPLRDGGILVSVTMSGMQRAFGGEIKKLATEFEELEARITRLEAQHEIGVAEATVAAVNAATFVALQSVSDTARRLGRLEQRNSHKRVLPEPPIVPKPAGRNALTDSNSEYRSE